jgi:capsular exopolysaccharide synthesis family protein
MLKDIENQKNLIADQYKDRLVKFSNDFELGLFLHVFRKSIWWIVLFFILSFIGVIAYLRYSETIYNSKTIIQLSKQDKANEILNVGTDFENNNKLAESIEILKSQVFLKRVSERLNIPVSYFNEGTFKNYELYKSSPYQVNAKIKNSIWENNPIYIKIDIDNKVGTLTLSKNNIRVINFKLNEWFRNNEIELSVTLNPFIQAKDAIAGLRRFDKSYFILNSESSILNLIKSNLDVKVINDQSQSISIEIKNTDPTKAADIANAIAEEFQIYGVEKESESSKKILDFIDEQLNTVFYDLKQSESNIEEFRKKYNYSSDDNLKANSFSRFSKIEDQLLKIELDEMVLSDLQKDLQKNKSIDSYVLLSLLAGSEEETSIRSVTSELKKLSIEKENLLYNLSPGSEAVKQINSQIDIQKKLLFESINSYRNKLKTKYTNLKGKSNEISSGIDAQPDREMEYSRLMRMFNINEKYYTLLLEKKTEFSISNAGYVSNTSILESATPNLTPSSPSKKSAISIGIIIAFLVSLILLSVRYFLNDQLLSLNEIVKKTQASIPTLGIIPVYDNNVSVSQLIVQNNPKSIITESFRTIRSNLQFISNTDGPKLAALTSTVSGEGKTFVALNIAGIVAYTGQKVLIIDLDMRKPKIHKGFGVKNEKGISTILIGINTIEECVQKTVIPTLDFITSGPEPPNPSELIISNKMNELLEELKKRYDFIVIDNPPIGLVSDALPILKQVDFPIFIFRSEYSKKSYIEILDRLKNESKISNLSVVLNAVNISRSNYGYNYGYGYGYGYSQNYGYYTDNTLKKRKKK